MTGYSFMSAANPIEATVVVVDDQTSVRTALTRAMDSQGYRTIALASAQDCIKFCLHNTPDAILLDSMMPEMDGFTCCKLLQAALGDDCPPILMVTALDDRHSVDRAFEVGAKDFITKPIHWPVLYNRLSELIRSHRNSVKLRQEITRSQRLAQQLELANQDLELKVSQRASQLQDVLTFESLLKRITDRVRETLDEGNILRTVVDELATCLRLSSASVGLLKSGCQAYTIQFDCALSLPSCEGRIVRADDHPDVWWCFQQGYSVYHTWLHPLQGKVVALDCPLMDEDGRLLGVLNLMRPHLGSFSRLEIRLAEQVANQCAIAIRQAQLYGAAKSKISELQRLAELKDDFMSTVSHELRTPLTSMRMSLQMLKHASHPDKRQRYLSMLESECEREIRLVEDLLLMRELTVQLDSEQRHRLELGQLVGSIVEANSSAPHAQHVDITFATSPHKYWVHLNEHYLSRVLNELLENACKHSGSRGRVSIDVSERACQHNWVAIGVRNDGEIPQAELQHLFDTFHRVSQGDRWQTSGTGLGLALVKQIVERLGGSISVTSAGGWVQFDLHLPLEHPPKIPAATTQPLATAAPMAMSRSSR
ncbi:MAG: response regulator [Cyanobacteria bacterium J06642_12]